MKSKKFQKSQNKAKIGQKSQNWPKRPTFSKKDKKCQCSPYVASEMTNSKLVSKNTKISKKS
jgi:hypothetical protein